MRILFNSLLIPGVKSLQPVVKRDRFVSKLVYLSVTELLDISTV